MTDPRPKKKIAIVQFYYYPDISAVSQLLGDMLGRVARDNQYEFTVYCGSSVYSKNRESGKREWLRRWKNNVRIKRIKTFNFGKGNIFFRLLDYSFYYIYIFFYFLFFSRADVVVTLTSPPLIGFFVALALSFRKKPLVYYIQDLYPEIIFDMGFINRPWLIRKLQFLNRLTVRKAARIITIGEYMKQKIKSNYHADVRKISVIHNWALESDYGMKGAQPSTGSCIENFELLYSGNMGVAHDFDNFKYLVKSMKNEKHLFYHFIGGGKKSREVKKLFRETGESRFRLEGYARREHVGKNMANADILLISQKRETVGDILPSKFYSYLLAGKPLLFLGPRRSEIAEIIDSNDIGIVLENAGDVGKVHKYLLFLKENPEVKKIIGQRALRLYEQKYQLGYAADSFKSELNIPAGVVNA